jgi:rubrerythrin
MFNPVIIVAIIIQVLISKASRIAGAIFGYLITTGVLIWGISVYGERGSITFFGIHLSETVFIIACLIWYAFDTRELIAAQKLTKKKQEFECSKCGTSVRAEDKFCPKCGANLEEIISKEENYVESTTSPESSEINEKLEYECSECGTSVREEDKLCPKCGAILDDNLSKEKSSIESPKTFKSGEISEKLEYECSECGTSVRAEDKFCPKCGVNLEEIIT